MIDQTYIMRTTGVSIFPLTVLAILTYGEAIIFGVDYRGLDGPQRMAPFLFYEFIFPFLVIVLYGINKLMVLPLFRILHRKGMFTAKIIGPATVFLAFIPSAILTFLFAQREIDQLDGILKVGSFLLGIFLFLGTLNAAAYYLAHIQRNDILKNRFILINRTLILISLAIFFVYLYLSHTNTLKIIE